MCCNAGDKGACPFTCARTRPRTRDREREKGCNTGDKGACPFRCARTREGEWKAINENPRLPQGIGKYRYLPVCLGIYSGQCAATLATRASALLAVRELAHELGRERERLLMKPKVAPKAIPLKTFSIYRYISVYIGTYWCIHRYISVNTFRWRIPCRSNYQSNLWWFNA